MERVSAQFEEILMNLNLTGNHLDITPAIRDYVVAKLDRITRHFDHVIDVQVVMSVAKLRHKIEANPARPRLLMTEPGVGYRLRTE